MARPKIKSYWRQRIREITENEPRIGPARIERRLEEEANRLGRSDYPKERTIGRIQREFRRKPEEERLGYREFRWPESMECRALPWEATLAGLELLRQFRSFKKRPLVGLVRWFWRISQIAPDAPYSLRFIAAQELFYREAFGRADPAAWESTARHFERLLAYGWWRSDAARKAYEAVEEDDPIPTRTAGLFIDDDTPPELLDAMSGYVLSEQERQEHIKEAQDHRRKVKP